MEQLTDKHINTDKEYVILSLKHTASREKLITLWRPDNAGYTMHYKSSGVYKGYEPGYHDSLDNMALLKSEADSLVKDVKYWRETIAGIPNTPAIRRKLGAKYKRGNLLKDLLTPNQ